MDDCCVFQSSVVTGGDARGSPGGCKRHRVGAALLLSYLHSVSGGSFPVVLLAVLVDVSTVVGFCRLSEATILYDGVCGEQSLCWCHLCYLHKRCRSLTSSSSPLLYAALPLRTEAEKGRVASVLG